MVVGGIRGLEEGSWENQGGERRGVGAIRGTEWIREMEESGDMDWGSWRMCWDLGVAGERPGELREYLGVIYGLKGSAEVDEESWRKVT